MEQLTEKGDMMTTILDVRWVDPQQKKPDKERFYAITIRGLLKDRISAALWNAGHWYRGGEMIDSEVIRWADGLEPYKEPKGRRRTRK